MSDNPELRDVIAGILSANWSYMHTNEALGRQRMLADAVIACLPNHGYTITDLHPEITTAEELDALPTNSVVIDAGRWIHERWERAVPDDHGWVRVGWAFNEPADPPTLPARVLHRPDTEVTR
ncbi:hypothetical protein [Prescottella equi]|uniref:hypothetical protein n=1 Tax=Rhodococcus hoagii TaxID=43767 RepID=UPI0023DA06B7|nr:hypothetical protein [Prescottella equi]